ncbi:hypothetical protein ABW19_dt0206187 [Dactylella cylindrospora]|nr:hypothetical protein ABW19_dt0206187 [Dactylella cylindrospora]
MPKTLGGSVKEPPMTARNRGRSRFEVLNSEFLGRDIEDLNYLIQSGQATPQDFDAELSQASVFRPSMTFGTDFWAGIGGDARDLSQSMSIGGQEGKDEYGRLVNEGTQDNILKKEEYFDDILRETILHEDGDDRGRTKKEAVEVEENGILPLGRLSRQQLREQQERDAAAQLKAEDYTATGTEAIPEERRQDSEEGETEDMYKQSDIDIQSDAQNTVDNHDQQAKLTDVERDKAYLLWFLSKNEQQRESRKAKAVIYSPNALELQKDKADLFDILNSNKNRRYWGGQKRDKSGRFAPEGRRNNAQSMQSSFSQGNLGLGFNRAPLPGTSESSASKMLIGQTKLTDFMEMQKETLRASEPEAIYSDGDVFSMLVGNILQEKDRISGIKSGTGRQKLEIPDTYSIVQQALEEYIKRKYPTEDKR